MTFLATQRGLSSFGNVTRQPTRQMILQKGTDGLWDKWSVVEIIAHLAEDQHRAPPCMSLVCNEENLGTLACFF